MDPALRTAVAPDNAVQQPLSKIYRLNWLILALLLLANIGFVGGGFYLAFLKTGEDIFGRLVGLFGAGFFGLTLLTVIGDIVRFGRGPVLTIDSQGLWDLRMSPRPIPWQELRGAYIGKIKLTKFICLDLTDPEPYLPAPHSFRGLMARLNPIMKYTEFTTATLPLTGTAEDILAAIEFFGAQASEEGSSSRR